MEGVFSTQVILAKAQAVVEDGYSPDVGIVIDLLRTKESIQASMTPVALQEQSGLYMYRFQVPVGDSYRFRLSSRLSPAAMTKHPSILSSKLIDYAIRRAAAEDGICANHFQTLANGNELHLGEADYLALLAQGQCACTVTTTTSSDHAVDTCFRCPFVKSCGKEVGDAPVNAGLSLTVDVLRHGRMNLCGDLAWPKHFEQRRCVSEELLSETLDEPEASFPEPDRPATGLDALLLVDDRSADVGRRSVENKEDLREAAKWNGVFASGEDGDCLQRRLHQQEARMLPKPSDEQKAELERDAQSTCRSLTTAQNAWSNESLEFDAGFRLGWAGPGLASAGDEPWAPGPLRPDPVLASATEEPWSSAVCIEPVFASFGDELWAPSVRPDSVLESAGDDPWVPIVRLEPVLESAGDEPWASAVHRDSVLASAGDEPWAPAVRPDSVLASAGDEPWAPAVRPDSVLASAGDEPWAPAVRPDSVLASAGDEPWTPAVRPDAVLASAGDEPWTSAVRPDSVLASAGDEPWSPAVRPDSVLASAGDEPWAPAVRPNSAFESAGDEPWSSAAEGKDDTRETYVFERCQRHCVHANEKENIVFAVFDDRQTFLLPSLNENFRQSLCFSTPPLPSNVVRDLSQLISGNLFFRLVEEADTEPSQPVDVSDSHPLLSSAVETSHPELTSDVETSVQPRDSKHKKQSSRTSKRHALLSEDSEIVVVSSPRSATAAETAIGAITEVPEEVETGCGVSESYEVNFEMRLQFWRRAKRAVTRAFQRIRDFFRGLRFWGRARQHSTSRRGRRSHPSWGDNAERVDCEDSSKV